MKKTISGSLIHLLSILSFVYAGVPGDGDRDTLQWRAGVAQAVITPEEPMWMAGYASRNRPSEGKLHDLRAKGFSFGRCGREAGGPYHF